MAQLAPHTAPLIHSQRADILRPHERARRSPDPLERLMAHAVDWITIVVPAAAAAFSPVDRRLNAFAQGPVVMKLTSDRLRLQAGEARMAYVRTFGALDPFAPWRWADSTATVVGVEDVGGRERFASSPFATAFLASYGLADQASVYLRDRGRIVGVIVLQRAPDEPAVTREELAQLRRAQPLLEGAYALGQRRVDEAERPETLSCYGLTPRETDVARLVATGATNAEISRALYMSVATVKTHMTHVFAKVGLRSRTELVLLLTDRQPQGPARTHSIRRVEVGPAAAR